MDSLVKNLFEREREQILRAVPKQCSDLAALMAARNVFYGGRHVTLHFDIHAGACKSIAKALLGAFQQVAADTAIPPSPVTIDQAKRVLREAADTEIERISRLMDSLCTKLNSGASLVKTVKEDWLVKLRREIVQDGDRDLDIWFETESRKTPRQPSVSVEVGFTQIQTPPHQPSDSDLKLGRLVGIATIIGVIIAVIAYVFPRSPDGAGITSPVAEVIVTPLDVMQLPNSNTLVRFKVLNVGKIDAYKVSVDAKFANRSWTSEWVKARHTSSLARDKKGVISGARYGSHMSSNIEVLRAGDSTIWYAINALHLEDEVCGINEKTFPISVRLAWENVSNRPYDEIRKYGLLCTKDVEGAKPGRGRAFTFLVQ